MYIFAIKLMQNKFLFKIFNKNKSGSSVPFTYSKRISWARALYKRIEDPMHLLKVSKYD